MAASRVGVVDNVVLKTDMLDSQTLPAATLSAMWKTDRKYKSQSPRAKEIRTKFAPFDW